MKFTNLWSYTQVSYFTNDWRRRRKVIPRNTSRALLVVKNPNFKNIKYLTKLICPVSEDQDAFLAWNCPSQKDTRSSFSRVHYVWATLYKSLFQGLAIQSLESAGRNPPDATRRALKRLGEIWHNNQLSKMTYCMQVWW